MGNVLVISTADALCGSHTFQHNFCSSLHSGAHCQIFLGSIESLLVAVIPLSHWSALNTPEDLGVHTTKKSKGSCRPVDWASASYPLFTLSVGSGGASSCMNLHVSLLMKVHMFQVYWQIIHQNDGTQAPVSLLGKTSGPKELIT
jgi:hypothetical protein